jgi:hypothetical protein
MAASSRRYLVEGIAAVVIAYSLVLLRGKPQIWIFQRRYPCRGIIFGAAAGWRGSEAERFASSSSTTARLGSVVQQISAMDMA